MSKKRCEFDDKYKWDLSVIYKNEKEFTKAYDKLVKKLDDYSKFEGHIMDDAKTLYEFLEFDTTYSNDLDQVFLYAHLLNDEDTTDTKGQEMFGKVYNLFLKCREITSFVVPEILKSSYDLVEEYIKCEPKLKAYERVLKDIFKMKPHTLSDAEEKLISCLSCSFKTPDEVYSLLTDADLKFGTIINDMEEEEELSEKNYAILMESKNRDVRRNAFTRFFETYGSFKNTYSGLLSNEVTNNNKIAEIRGFGSAREESLFQNDIPVSIYDNLILGVKKHVSSLSNYWELKKDLLDLPDLHIYDTLAPIVKDYERKYTIEEAQNIVIDALIVLGEDYVSKLKEAFDKRWVDFCPNEGKRNGGYCTSCYNVHPFVLMNFDGSFDNVSTLAHELGHAMQDYYSITNQTSQDYNYSIFVAEVGSQVNQILLARYLIDHTDDASEKKYLIDSLIGDFKAAVYRQTMFAEFEKIIHEKEANGEVLTNEVLCDTYYKLNLEYYGDNIVVDDLIKYEWQRIPHFYMNFYVYQYSTAYTAAIKIAMDILNKKDNAVENYIKFLGLGSSKTPVESLRQAGVDMERAETLDEAFEYFDNLVKELKEICEV